MSNYPYSIIKLLCLSISLLFGGNVLAEEVNISTCEESIVIDNSTENNVLSTVNSMVVDSVEQKTDSLFELSSFVTKIISRCDLVLASDENKDGIFEPINNGSVEVIDMSNGQPFYGGGVIRYDETYKGKILTISTYGSDWFDHLSSPQQLKIIVSAPGYTSTELIFRKEEGKQYYRLTSDKTNLLKYATVMQPNLAHSKGEGIAILLEKESVTISSESSSTISSDSTVESTTTSSDSESSTTTNSITSGETTEEINSSSKEESVEGSTTSQESTIATESSTTASTTTSSGSESSLEDETKDSTTTEQSILNEENAGNGVAIIGKDNNDGNNQGSGKDSGNGQGVGLPQTGNEENKAMAGAGVMLVGLGSLFGLSMFRRRKEN